MPKRLKLIKGFLNNQSINEVVGLNIAYSNSNYGAENYPSAYAMGGSKGIAFDAFGNLWIADNGAGGTRIVMYPPQNQFNGQPATFLIGQSSFSTFANAGITQSSMSSYRNGLICIAFDKNNNLWVSDGAPRLLGFKYPFGSGGILNASWVIGQDSFTSSATGVSANLFSTTINGIVFDNQNNLWVMDTTNNRVLGFSANKIYSINPSASWVIGQPDFTSNTANNGGISDKSLSLAGSALVGNSSISIDKNDNLWIVDMLNYRILGYENPQGIMPAANYVIGQSNFTTANSGASQNTFISPFFIAFDSLGNLWVFDYNRVIGFSYSNLYMNNQPNASWLMFQTSFTADSVSTLNQEYAVQYDMAGFFYPVTVPNDNIVSALPNPYQIGYQNFCPLAFDKNDNLWIVDISNYRILKYKNSDITSNAYPYNCSAVLGQSQYYIQGQLGCSQYTMGGGLSTENIGMPIIDLAFDKNNNVWIADPQHNRLVGFEYPNYNQQVMQNWVIGQPNFTSSGNGSLPNGGILFSSVTFDSSGNLWTGDSANNIVIAFPASGLYGNNQPNYIYGVGNGSSGLSQNQLNIAMLTNTSYAALLVAKVAFDSAGNLYVTDFGNNRVMVFDVANGFNLNVNASIVLGQANFTTASGTLLNQPTGIAFDSSGNLWVSTFPAGSNGNTVVKFTPPFTTNMSATMVISGFNYPTGIIFSKDGFMYVSDTHNNRILGFPPSVLNANSNTTTASATVTLGTGSAGLSNIAINNPTGLAINPETGDLMCVDAGNNRVVGWYYIHKETQSNALDSKYIFYNE